MDKDKIKEIAQAQVKNQKWNAFMQQISDAAVRTGKIAHATFELTALCTLQCKMCYVRLDKETADKIGPMRTAKEWIDMARQFRDSGGLTILLTGGEAMMRPDFLEIYEEISKMGLFVTVFTNGTTITDEVIEMFRKRPPALIGLTLYGASEETYQRTTGVKGFENAVKGMDRLLTIPNLHIDVRFTACTLNYMDYEKVQELVEARGLVLSYDVADMASVRGAVSEGRALRLNLEQREQIRKHLQKVSAPILDAMHKEMERMPKKELPNTSYLTPIEVKKNKKVEDPLEERRLHCRAAAFGVYIAYDGRMYPCDTFSEPYFTEPFKEGFVSAYQRLQEIAREILVPESCMKCKNIDVCGPCAARLIAEKEACAREGVACSFDPI